MILKSLCNSRMLCSFHLLQEVLPRSLLPQFSSDSTIVTPTCLGDTKQWLMLWVNHYINAKSLHTTVKWTEVKYHEKFIVSLLNQVKP